MSADYGGVMQRLRRLAIFLFVLAIANSLVPHVSAQSSLRRLTTTGDVMDFVWSPKGDSLFVTRSGKIISLATTRQQITGELYQTDIENGNTELLADDANAVSPAPSGDEIAFARLDADGSARLIRLQLRPKVERDVDAITWGAFPQWNRAGIVLFYAQSGRLTGATQTTRTPAFDGQNLPPDTRVSPTGERAAFVNARLVGYTSQWRSTVGFKREWVKRLARCEMVKQK